MAKPERICHSPDGMEQGNATIIGEIEIDALTREPLRIVIPSVLSVLSIDVIVDRRK